jgi:hypothetical protein
MKIFTVGDVMRKTLDPRFHPLREGSSARVSGTLAGSARRVLTRRTVTSRRKLDELRAQLPVRD